MNDYIKENSYSDYKFKSEIIIKHVTPMIHFQFGKPTYLLRSTEVKPMLDKYLHTKSESSINKKWLIENQPKALKYKMHIDFEEKCEKSSGFIKTIIFSKLENDTPNLKITLLSLCDFDNDNPGLLDFIEDNLKDFFSSHNFGKTKSKNFGKFELVSINNKPV